MNSSRFVRGEILEATLREKPKGVHYIVKYSPNTSSDFIGGMISTKNYRGKNIPMSNKHFVDEDADGNKFKISYKNSHLVPAKLIKPECWGTFTKVGDLTPEGVKFVEQTIGDLNAQSFERYLNETT